MQQQLLSVIVPVFNEAANLRPLVERLSASLSPLELDHEILCVDDGSRDGSAELLSTLAAEYPTLRCIHFTRNFGKEAALQAGLELARGDAAVFLDADLQHPPELIPRMVELWCEEGFDVVDARKRTRGTEGPFARLGAAIFNRLLGAATQGDMAGASDFKLLSRPAIDALRSLPERKRFFRGLVHWIGYDLVQIDFDVSPRAAGRSRWSRLGLLRYAIDSLVSFTVLPLVLIACAGLLTTLLGSVLGLIALQQWARGDAVSGFTTVILLVSIFSGFILTSLGVMSLYIARLFEEVKGRPIFMIRNAAKARHPASPRKPGR